MKTQFYKKTLGAAMLLLACAALNAQTDLVPGINYSYTPPGSDGIIHSISIDACNNDVGAAGSFDVAMYLYDQATTNYYIIGMTNIGSLSGSSCVTISNWDIDINNTSGIPAGTYRLGIWVDNNTAVSETDENNNAGLLSGNINYSPGGVGIRQSEVHFNLLGNFPNPANETSTVSFSLAKQSKVSVTVYDISGKKVQEIAAQDFLAGKNAIVVDCAKLEAGVYFYTVHCNDAVETKRFLVQH